MYDYGARNNLLLGHLVIIGSQTNAQEHIANVRVHPVFQDQDARKIPGNWFQHEIEISATNQNWAEVQLTDDLYGFSPHEGPKMDSNEVGEAKIWRGKIYAFPASKTNEMRQFLQSLFI